MSEQFARSLMGAGALVRLSYGLGALVAPDAMSSHRLAPDVRGHADGRMDFRGFGGLHINIALLTLRAAIRNRNTRLLLRLNVGCELSDMAATLLEWRDRDRADRVVRGSLALASIGLATWIAALRGLRDTE
jgi:hypothetical protein